MGTILQYSHTSDTPFDFNDKNSKAGFHRLGTENSLKNAPSGVNPVYSNVLVVRNNAWDTLSMTIYLYTKGANSSVVYKTGNTTDWANLSWSVYATKSDLVDIGKPNKLCSFSATGNASVSLSAYKMLFIAGIYNGQILVSQMIPKSLFNNSGMFLAYKDNSSLQYLSKLILGSSTIECTIFENFSSCDVYGIS